MSLRRKQTDIRSLSFDPFLTEAENGFKRRFEWAIDHESQQETDWCWAACLSNALSCVGTYINQDEIVDRFRNDLMEKFQNGHDSPPDATDQRIPCPKYVIDLWRSYGFESASFLDRQLLRDDLMEELVANGPVQIELWKPETKEARHLALVFGVRETSDGIVEVGISDPLAKETLWRTYDALAGSAPLVEKFGEWRRTYISLGYQKGYLRRFYGRPSRFLTGLPDEASHGGQKPTVPAVDSQLKLERPPHPDPPLPNELSVAMYGYRHYRYRDAPEEKKESRRADLLQPLFLFESIPIHRPPYEIDYHSPLRGQLRPYRWHHQIHNANGPRYYAEAWFFPKLRQQFDRAWRTAWIGERWRAKRVDDAIQKLDADFKDHPDTVVMVLFRRHGLVTLFLPDSGIHMVVSAHAERQTTFPLLATFTDEQLRKAIAELSSATTTQSMDQL